MELFLAGAEAEKPKRVCVVTSPITEYTCKARVALGWDDEIEDRRIQADRPLTVDNLGQVGAQVLGIDFKSLFNRASIVLLGLVLIIGALIVFAGRR